MYYNVIKYDGHLRTIGKTSRRPVFSTFLECSQMSWVFYHSVIHGSSFFICFKTRGYGAKNNKTSFFYVLYSDKTVLDQSESAQPCPIRIIRLHTRREVSSNTWLKCTWSNLVPRVSHLPAPWSERSRAQKREPSLLSLQGARRWETLWTRLLQVHLKVLSRALENLVSHLMRKYVTSSIFALLL